MNKVVALIFSLAACTTLFAAPSAAPNGASKNATTKNAAVTDIVNNLVNEGV